MKKISLEELKNKQIRLVSIKTESKDHSLVENGFSYDDKLIIGEGMVDYSKKSSHLENDGNTTDIRTNWNYETSSERLDEKIEKVFEEVMKLVTKEKQSKDVYCNCNGIYFSIYFEDKTTYNAAFYIPGSEMNDLVNAIKDMIPENLETPMLCDL